MRRRTLFAVLLALAVVASALAAGSQAMTDRAKASKVTTVTLNGWQVSPAEETKLSKVVNDFNKSHPQIHVDYQSITGDYQAQELAKFAARKPPDVLYVDVADIRDWVGQGVLQPLDSYVKSSHFSTKPYIKNLLNAFKANGHIYGFPKDWSSLGMEVNTTLLGNNPIPKTWAQLKSVASTTDVLAATPDKLGSSWCGEAFGKQKVAFAFEGNWMFPTMASFPGVKFTTAPLPKGKTRGNLAFTVSYSMAKDSKHKAAAWQLLKYLVGRQGMQQWVSLGLALPTRSDVHAVKGRGAFTKYPAFVHGWGAQRGFRHIWNDVANNELTAVIAGKESVNSMLQKIAAAAG